MLHAVHTLTESQTRRVRCKAGRQSQIILRKIGCDDNLFAERKRTWKLFYGEATDIAFGHESSLGVSESSVTVTVFWKMDIREIKLSSLHPRKSFPGTPKSTVFPFCNITGRNHRSHTVRLTEVFGVEISSTTANGRVIQTKEVERSEAYIKYWITSQHHDYIRLVENRKLFSVWQNEITPASFPSHTFGHEKGNLEAIKSHLNP